MRFTRFIAALAAVSLVWTPHLQAQTAKEGKKSEEKDDPFFTGPPFSLDDLLQRVGVIADRRLRIAVLRRGVSFSPTPQDYEKLKSAGATPELIQTIAVKAPPPPKPAKPTPPPTAGPLLLECAPAECAVSVNGKPHGSTSKGTLEIRDLPPGDTVIEFSRDGFEPRQITVALHAGAPASQSVRLKPNAATLAQQGRDVVAKMTAKLGGAEGLRQSSILSGAGNASLWQSGGQRTEWKMISKLKLPAMAMIEINGAGLKWWTSLAGSDSKADGSKQMRGGPVAVEMEKLVRLYRDYQPAMLVEALRKMKVSAVDPAPGANGEWTLRAAGADESLTIVLSPDFLPSRVRYDSASGLGSGLEILYSDYAAIGKAQYPKSFAIRFADQAQHGLQIRLDTVNFEANLANREFHR
ncbi:MAG TPA: carboxypeptidase-like regulatory domain-containing protein [Bryobacteraceae bacterium]|jgi:hypothetical protein|nr:carboxypeptidase-like regulatory domain-containing protein [Bryobacteraceae bacterium]